MSIVKRMSAPVGLSRTSGSKSASAGGFVCPHCQRQSALVNIQGSRVCQICRKAPQE